MILFRHAAARSLLSPRLLACAGVLTLSLQAALAQPPVTDTAAQAVVGLQQPLRSQVQGQPQPVLLDIPAGQVVQLRFEGVGLHLDLHDRQGTHLRRLAENGRGVQTAMWRTQGAGQEQLWVMPAADSSTPQAFEMQILSAWDSEGPAPLPPEDTPMGPRLQALQRSLAQGHSSNAFWLDVQRHGAPLVEPWDNGQVLVTFVWRDQGHQNVRLFGSPSGDHSPLRRLEGSDVWWTSVVMDPRARLSYALAPDVPQLGQAHASQQRRAILATLQRDPLNPLTFPSQPWSDADDRYHSRSVMTLPAAPAQPWVQARPGAASGTLTRHVVHSQVLGNDRDVWTYVPAGVQPQGLLVLFDAHTFVHDVPTPRILDNLVADGLLPPVAAVIVGNASPQARGVELPPNPQFTQFMAQELMPWVQQQGLEQPARRTVVAGSSYGGLASSYLGLMHPELFGNVLSMSGSYWWAPQGETAGWMQRAWQALPAPMPHVRFYLDAGRFETTRGGRAGILETSRALGDMLKARGLEVVQREFISGHDPVQWQASLGCGLVALLAPQQLQDARMQVCEGVPR